MPRLFVALELPAAATVELARIQPPPTEGVHLVQRHQMHVTLHFLGKREVERVAAALASVQAGSLPLTLSGVGRFSTDAGAIILWAGVKRCPALLDLQTAVATALADDGFQAESRTYIPHVTLAKCESEAGGVVDQFLDRHAGFSLPNVPAEGFRLCSSYLVGGEPTYRIERSFQPRPTSRTA